MAVIQLEMMRQPTPLEKYELGVQKIYLFYKKKQHEKCIVLNEPKTTTETDFDEMVIADG